MAALPSTDDLPRLYREYFSSRAQWKAIGCALGISTDDLEAISLSLSIVLSRFCSLPPIVPPPRLPFLFLPLPPPVLHLSSSSSLSPSLPPFPAPSLGSPSRAGDDFVSDWAVA